MTEAATAQTHAGGLQGFFDSRRTLETYPTGSYRYGLLLLALVANVLIYFDLGLSGLLPLWMSSLHFSAKQFGYFLTCAVVLSGLAGLISGPLADRHGRVMVIDVCLLAQVFLTFANLYMTSFWSFVLVRGLMFVIAGLAHPALFGLIRDLTPRLGRASGFAVVNFGATASQWVWTFVPGITLSRFHSWQSQIWLMSIFGMVLFIPSILWLKDLHARLRLRVIESETAASVRIESKDSAIDVPKTARAAFAELLGRWEIWVLVIGSASIVTVPITIQTYGPLIFVQALKYTPAEASKMASYFFLAQTLLFIPGGYLSDLLGTRKPLSLVWSALLATSIVWWAAHFSQPISPFGLGIVNVLLGGLWSLAYAPWSAFYSEYLEDVSPALQATGWSFEQAGFRFWLASAGLLQPTVAQRFGWGTWVWIVALGVAAYMLSLIAVRGYWGRTASGASLRAHAPTPEELARS